MPQDDSGGTGGAVHPEGGFGNAAAVWGILAGTIFMSLLAHVVRAVRLLLLIRSSVLFCSFACDFTQLGNRA